MTTALIVVDVQHDFAHPDGGLFVPGGDSVPAKVNDLLKDYEIIVYTQDWHPADTSHFADHGGPWPTHCVAGTWGADFHSDLNVLNDGYFIRKGTDPGEDGYSAFFGEVTDGVVSRTVPTGLDKLLSRLGVLDVHVAGIALDVCVRATALDAVELGYDTTVIVDATAAVTPEGATETLEDFERAGVYIL